jgi:hypothetical protein
MEEYYNRKILEKKKRKIKVIDLIWFTKTTHIHVELKKKLFLTNFINFQNIHYVCLMVFNATFNNIAVISCRSILLVEEIGGNHRPVASH